MAHEQYQSCIEACYRCAAACDHCAVACLEESDVANMSDCIRLDMDCADICRLAAAAMARDSHCAKQICELCADICEKCAKECEQHEHAHCQACARECKNCAEQCRQMAV